MTLIDKHAKWIICIAFLLLFPSFFYYILAIGLLPNSYFIFIAFAYLASATRIVFGDIIIVAIALTHVAIYTLVYRWLSKLIVFRIYKVQSQNIRVVIVTGIVVALVMISFLFPIYFSMGQDFGPTNIIGVFNTLKHW